MMDKRQFQPVSTLRGDDDRDTSLLKAMAREARSYIASFHWAPSVKEQYLAFGIGGIVAVFWFEFVSKIGNTDESLWVVVGDLPSAYLVADAGNDPKAVLATYCDLMIEWAEKVIVGIKLEDTFPVGVEPTIKNAHALQKRVAFLREEVIGEMPSAADGNA